MGTPSILQTLYSECQGYLELRALGAKKAREFFQLNDHAGIKNFIHNHRGADLYFSVSTRDGKAGAKDNIVNIPAVWIDIDYKTVPGGEQEALRILDAFPLQPTVRVGSGGGCHGYWKLKEPCGREEIPQLEAIMRGLAARLNGDPACCEVGRILRIPNTTNHKYKPPRPVVMTHCNGTEFCLSDFDPFVDDDPNPTTQHSASAKHAHLDRIMCCKFMQHCRESAGSLPEPEWRAMITQLMREVGGVSLIHAMSKPHPKYKKSETTKKIESCLDTTGPHTCESIKRLWDCGMDCRVKAPAGLAYRLAECHLDQETTVTNETTVTTDAKVTNCNKPVTNSVTNSAKINAENEDTISLKVEQWLECCDGVFSAKELALELQLYLNTSAYNNIRVILNRLCKKRIIEKHGLQRGVYRKVESAIAEMAWWDADDEEFDIDLPLDLNGLVRIYPKNIIIIAGEKNAAKTCLALNISRMNFNHHAVHYFSSEMGPVEFKSRVRLFENVPMEEWRKLKVYERTENFHDVIRPNDINIIDYMEIHDEYYKVGGWIRAIHDRLENGVAIVCLQKKTGQDFGRGGEVTAEKARVYIALNQALDHMDRPITRAKIVKCKAPRDPRHHPYGWVRDFRIHGGWDIDPLTPWAPEKRMTDGKTRQVYTS